MSPRSEQFQHIEDLGLVDDDQTEDLRTLIEDTTLRGPL